MADDPFDVFGSDGEGDEQQVSAHWASQQLISQANKRIAQPKQQQEEETANTNDRVVAAVDISTLSPISLFDAPLYLGNILLVDNLPVGGGRGYIVRDYLPPGTLIMVEQPMISYPESQLGKPLGLVSVQHILTHSKAQEMLCDLEHFYPTKQQVDRAQEGEDYKLLVQVTDMIESLMEQNKDEELLRDLLQLAQNRQLTNIDTTPLTSRDLIRLLLVLRYNGLESGVYKHVAMLNHSEQPNCVKFLPSTTTTTDEYSEVRTTRPIQAGESLTISYLPRIVSHASRRWHLWEQHRFDIGADIADAKLKSMEMVGKRLPMSSIDPHKHRDDSVTARIETATQELEDHYQEAAEKVVSENVSDQVWEETKTLELTALELCTEAKHQLRNDKHLLLIPCLRLHLDTCDLVQRGANSQLTFAQRIQLLLRLVVSAKDLIALQREYYGHHHFELAKTHLELAQAIQELLSRSSSDLIGLQLEGMSSFAACSSVEHESRKEYQRISDLYPKDAELYIAQR